MGINQPGEKTANFRAGGKINITELDIILSSVAKRIGVGAGLVIRTSGKKIVISRKKNG